MLDGQTVTHVAYISNSGFAFVPSYDLPYIPHRVQVRGVLKNGQRCIAAWTFVNQAAAPTNFLEIARPHNGQHIGSTLFIEGVTHPYAQIEIDVSANPTFQGFVTVTEATTTARVTADGRGAFVAQLHVVDQGASSVDIRLRSIAPDQSVVYRSLHVLP